MVRRCANPVVVHVSEIDHGTRVSEFSRFAKIPQRFCVCRASSRAFPINEAKIGTGSGIPLVGSGFQPVETCAEILWRSPPVKIKDGEIHLCVAVPPPGRRFKGFAGIPDGLAGS